MSRSFVSSLLALSVVVLSACGGSSSSEPASTSDTTGSEQAASDDTTTTQHTPGESEHRCSQELAATDCTGCTIRETGDPVAAATPICEATREGEVVACLEACCTGCPRE
ncbi:hypothetical protein [Sandaracinus amylolyticus]|uniref:Secreted protein n=1 Tax=Sandaracinus amylolyticus TaxID=927083 RepID=A0A0F6YLI9_9BACT|nr:hypothetical protein [Sandaracinus amylolyticus]AKF09513.1 hypothetical protein DB32_006662 [Sandaracinus amylolyticus]